MGISMIAEAREVHLVHGPVLAAGGAGGRRGAAGGAHAAAQPRRVRRPGAHRRARHGAAGRHRARRALQHDLLRAAGQRQDHAGATHRPRDRRPARAALGGQLGHGGRARRHPGRARGAHPRRGAHHPLHRRDPPLQQGAAGRPAAGHRGRHRHADRRDHREPLLRGQLGADLAAASCTASSRSAGARRAGRCRPRLADAERGLGGTRVDARRRRPRLPRRGLARRRARGAQRRWRRRGARAPTGERPRASVTVDDLRDATQKSPVSYDREDAHYDTISRLHQVDARQRPGRRRLLHGLACSPAARTPSSSRAA